MTEKEKMIACEDYDAGDKQLVADRLNAKNLLYKYNNLAPSRLNARNKLLKKLLGKMSTCHIEPPFRCDYGYNIFLGENFYSNYNLTVLDCAKVVIGDNVLIGPNVGLFTAGHPLDVEKRVKGIEFAKPITIGNNVWIGGGAIINPGVSIGDNTVIGAGSIVTKDIPANSVAVGNPCRVIKTL